MSAGTRWIGIVIGLLGASFAAQLILLAVASSDPAFAIEPDYERKARNWDAEQRQRSVNAGLGWAVAIRTQPTSADGGFDMTLTAKDRDGATLAGAIVEIEAMANARAQRIHRLELVEDQAGRYVGHVHGRRPGVWEFRVAITRGETRFTDRVRKDVLTGAVTRRSPGR